jgi:hypothetical protein
LFPASRGRTRDGGLAPVQPGAEVLEARVHQQGDNGRYCLTETGRALAPVRQELARWATAADSAALGDGDLDTAALMWDIQRRIDTAALPGRTVVIAIEFTDRATDRNFWLHLSRAAVSLCRQDTGAPVDVGLAAPAGETTRWWPGQQ